MYVTIVIGSMINVKYLLDIYRIGDDIEGCIILEWLRLIWIVRRL